MKPPSRGHLPPGEQEPTRRGRLTLPYKLTLTYGGEGAQVRGWTGRVVFLSSTAQDRSAPRLPAGYRRGVDLRVLRHVVAVAEERNIGPLDRTSSGGTPA